MIPSPRGRWLAGAMLAAGFGAGVFGAGVFGSALPAGSAVPDVNLVGTFSIAPGQCAATGAPNGSYLQVEVSGIALPNVTSPCHQGGGAFTPLTQGSAGLVTGAYQLDPKPTFNAVGDSLSSSIIKPVRFLANALGLSTTCANQSAAPTATGACPTGATGHPVPSVVAVPAGSGSCASTAPGECLYGDLSALGVTWAGFPIKPSLATLLTNPASILTALSATCVNSSGCVAAGASADPATGATQCVSHSDPGSCALFGTLDPATDDYTLALSTGIALSVVPDAVLHLVLKGHFTPGAEGTSGSTTTTSQPGAASGGGVGGSDSTTTLPSTAPQSSIPQNYVPSQTQQLLGTFNLSPSSCAGSTPTGSFLTVDFNTVSEGNASSPCAGGTYTLLQPGSSGLALGAFTPDPSPTFDGSGNSLANGVVAPALYKGHALGLATSPDDVQDAPAGPATFTPPVAFVQGTNLVVDLRSLNLTYDGPPGSTCAQSSGVGCWLEGSRVATGTYDPTTGAFTLDWYSSQDFSGGSGEVDFHLAGNFSGTLASADPAQVAQLQSSSYSVDSTSTQSETLAPSTSAAGGAEPSTTTSSAVGAPKGSDGPRVVRIGESSAPTVGHHAHGGKTPLLIVGLGIALAAGLLLIGRRSRALPAPTPEEQT